MMENPVALIEGLPLWGKILALLLTLAAILLIWRPWSKNTAAASTTTAAVTSSNAVPDTLAPGQQDAIVPTGASVSVGVGAAGGQVNQPLPTPSVPLTSAGSTAPPVTATAGPLAGDQFEWIPDSADFIPGSQAYYESNPGEFEPWGGPGGVGAPALPSGTPLYYEQPGVGAAVAEPVGAS